MIECFNTMNQVSSENYLIKIEDRATDLDPRSDVLNSSESDHGVDKFSNESNTKHLQLNEVRDDAVSFLLYDEEEHDSTDGIEFTFAITISDYDVHI